MNKKVFCTVTSRGSAEEEAERGDSVIAVNDKDWQESLFLSYRSIGMLSSELLGCGRVHLVFYQATMLGK